jgi:DNA processing protein
VKTAELIRISFIASALGYRLQDAVTHCGGVPQFLELLSEKNLERALRLFRISRDVLPSKPKLCEMKRQLERMQASVLSYEDRMYPPLLKSIDGAPPVLYVRGELETLSLPSIAVVGTRRASSSGRHLAERLGTVLAQHGANVVSGLAFGVDACAHKGALDGGGATTAVMPCGIDLCVPRSHWSLWQKIARHGCIVSDFPPGLGSQKRFYPWRNRIISGLSAGVVVVEAPQKSGALITADYALSQGREVFAVPGSPGLETSRGVNRLIREGAKLVETADDILEEFPALRDSFASGKPYLRSGPLTDIERRLLASLKTGTSSVDEIVDTTGLDVPAILAGLSGLEIRGVIRKQGQRYVTDETRQ